MTGLLHKELTHQIIGVYYDVYNGLGRTYPEFVYENAMRRDLQRRGISCRRQEEYQILYKDWVVGRQRLDLFLAGRVVVELKAVPHLTPLHKAQTFSYLKTLNREIGLLFNFGGPQPEFERLFFQASAAETPPTPIEQTAAELPADLIAPELVYQLIGGLYAVHTTLGPGFMARIYANACYRELQARGLAVHPQRDMQVIYAGESIAAIKFAHLRVGNDALLFPVAVSRIDAISFNNIKDWLRLQQMVALH
ncbi:MAG: GxxExxY protein [Chloroflexota bacterium]